MFVDKGSMTDRERVLRFLHEHCRDRYYSSTHIALRMNMRASAVGTHLKHWWNKLGNAVIKRREMRTKHSHGTVFGYRFVALELPVLPVMRHTRHDPAPQVASMKSCADRLARAFNAVDRTRGRAITRSGATDTADATD